MLFQYFRRYSDEDRRTIAAGGTSNFAGKIFVHFVKKNTERRRPFIPAMWGLSFVRLISLYYEAT